MMLARKESSTEYGRHIIKLETVKRCPIIVGDGILNGLEGYFDFSGYSGIVLITDTDLKRLYGQSVLPALKATGKKVSLFTLPVGEKAKSLSTVERGYRFLLENNVDRKGLICALGGGVVGDVGGYIAATYLRGIDYIQLPTTLLAQVDSSIGGKTGVDLPEGKNLLGAFYQPLGIYVDLSYLGSLETRQIRNGLAEVIKYGCICDKGLLQFITKEKKALLLAESGPIDEVVTRACSIKVEIVKGDEARNANPSKGTMARGSTRCLFCPQTLSPKEVKAQFMAGKSGRMMFAVAYKREGQSGTFFRAAKDADRAVFARAVVALTEAEAQHDDPFFPLVPDEPMPPAGAYGIYPQIYGVRTWGEMHNARQTLALVTFCRGVRDAHQSLLEAGATGDLGKAVTLYLAFTVSRMVLRMSEASRWIDKRDCVQTATAGHRLAIIWDYAEVNPLSGNSGSWEATLRWMLPAIQRLLGAGEQHATVRWGDAAKLAHPDDSFDAVLTDPAYYDSVPYGYLSDMQYVWLHRVLGDIMPEQFPAPLTPKNAEIVQDRTRHESDAAAKAFYEQRMSLALSEMRRVLKPDGIGMVMYAHTATSAWETLVKALIDAGLQVTASWPVNTETTSRRVWLGGAVLAATIFLVCRKRQGNRVAYLDEVLPPMREEVRRALARFWAAGIGGADFFISAIGPALSVYSQYSEVRYSSGQPVSVVSFLALVRQAVVDHSLSEALKGVDVGEVDRETQFTLLWRWTYGNQQVETGAALLLDKATGVELADLERHGLLTRANGAKKMVLLGPHQRPDLLDDTFRRVRAGRAPLIDAIHCAALLWRENRREELAELLEVQTEATRKVAQALAELQPQSSTERRLILGFLGNWNHMRGVASRVAESELAEQLSLDI